MDQRDRELDRAWEELTFWRDYTTWWNSQCGKAPQPRIRQALELAEQRYTSAVRERNLRRMTKHG